MVDVICLSHLRWNFVFQRPQHLLTRCAKSRRVFFVEEPIWGDGPDELHVEPAREGVFVVVPHLNVNNADPLETQRRMLLKLIASRSIDHYVLWYYTPMALPLGEVLSPLAVVYDCMDQLSAFKGAPPELVKLEAELLTRVDVMFTGGYSLYEAKQNHHPNVHPFPSSVDVEHFAKARRPMPDPVELSSVPRPRLGFFGVIDERMDLRLLEGVARARPEWQVVMVGPVVKISESELPRLPNIHYLGSKGYSELPAHIGAWDVALMPFAKNESTRFISPTKTPEYLAAGRPVVSTSIRDVVRPYRARGLVTIADTIPDFVKACEEALSMSLSTLLLKADAYLRTLSWDRTFSQMWELVEQALATRHGVTRISQQAVTGGQRRLPLVSGG